jgi:hypothetical protein
MKSWKMIREHCNFLSDADKNLVYCGNALRFVKGQV